MAIASVNPATGETLQTFIPLTDAEIETKLALAQQTFHTYRQTSLDQRQQWLTRTAELLETNRERYGRLITLEMGKPIKESIAEVEKSAWVCRYYAERGAEFLADGPIETDASQSFIRYQPLGIILAVMPWNFPFWQVFRFAAPALMAGNVGILKHASNVPQSALAIAEVISAAGFPAGAFQTLLVGADKVAQILADDRVKAATLTGSEPAGASLASLAGKLIKKTVLELGGSDPFIVMGSADLEAAVPMAVKARMINSGQSCIAAKRFIVAEAIADQFQQQLVERYAALKIGDPLHPDTQIGPLSTPAMLAEIEVQVDTAVAKGAKILIGGQSLRGSEQLPANLRQGNFYAPTILTNIEPHNPVYREEFFGPVALLFRVPDLDTAIQVANDSPFGLAASAWTAVAAERDRLINELEAGAVFINGMVKSDPRLPFGGTKRSGYGRELGREGIYEFMNIKTIWINL